MKQNSLLFLLFRSLLVSYAITTVLLFLVAYLLYALRLNASSVSVAVHAIYILSCLIGGFLLGKSQKSRRLLWGIVQGLLYISCLFIVSLILQRGITHSFFHTCIVFAICCGSGIVGAVMS